MGNQSKYEWTIQVTGAELIAKGTVAINKVPVDPDKKYLVIPESVKIEEVE